MRAALVAAAQAGVLVSQHAEDTRLTGGCSMNAGLVAFRLGLRGMTVEAEARIVERDIRLLREIEKAEGLRAHLHVQHVSTARAMDAIRAAKGAGLHVTCEVAPHHFTLTEEAIGDYDTHAKMNPPLRAEADRLAMIAGLMDGTVDCIATDHAPHAAREKVAAEPVAAVCSGHARIGLDDLFHGIKVIMEDSAMTVVTCSYATILAPKTKRA